MKSTVKKRGWVIAGIVVVAIAALLYWRNAATDAPSGKTTHAGGRAAMRMGGAQAPVQAATARSEAVPRYLTGLGTITAANTVTVRSRVDGQLMAIHFKEGQQVKAGDLLAEIDPSQFKVALAQAQGSSPKTARRLPTPVAIWRAISSLVKRTWFHARSSMPSRRWSAKPKAR